MHLGFHFSEPSIKKQPFTSGRDKNNLKLFIVKKIRKIIHEFFLAIKITKNVIKIVRPILKITKSFVG